MKISPGQHAGMLCFVFHASLFHASVFDDVITFEYLKLTKHLPCFTSAQNKLQKCSGHNL